MSEAAAGRSLPAGREPLSRESAAAPLRNRAAALPRGRAAGHESSEPGTPSPSRSAGGSGTYAACTTLGSLGTGGQLSASEKTCTGSGAGRTNGRSEATFSLQAEGDQPTPKRKRARGAPTPSVSAPPPARSTATPR